MYLIVVTVLVLAVGTAVAAEPNVLCCKENVKVEDGVCVNNNTAPTPVSLFCKKYVHIPDLDYEITDDGTLFISNKDNELREEMGSYCIWNGTNGAAGGVLVICDDAHIGYNPTNELVIGFSMLTSGVFLLITAFIYCVLSDIRDLLGKSIINMCANLGIAQCIMAGMKLLDYEHMGLCAARGFFAYYFFVSSFFWTNSISIQLLISIRRPTKSDYGWKRFLLYALYANGLPALLTIAMAIVNFYPGRHMKPGIGLNHCWFINKKQQWWYMYSVMSILILANVGIFVFLSIHLWRSSFLSSNIRALKYKFLMTVRLIVVMGLPWILELISSLVERSLLWVAIDTFSALQGLLIFFILVVLRKRVIKAMYKSGFLDCIAGPVEKHLAVGDDEEDIVHHTKDVPLDEKLPL